MFCIYRDWGLSGRYKAKVGFWLVWLWNMGWVFWGIFSFFFRFLRQLGHNLGLWVYVNNIFGTGVAKSVVKSKFIKIFFNKSNCGVVRKLATFEINKENSKRNSDLEKFFRKSTQLQVLLVNVWTYGPYLPSKWKLSLRRPTSVSARQGPGKKSKCSLRREKEAKLR